MARRTRADAEKIQALEALEARVRDQALEIKMNREDYDSWKNRQEDSVRLVRESADLVRADLENERKVSAEYKHQVHRLGLRVEALTYALVLAHDTAKGASKAIRGLMDKRGDSVALAVAE